MRQRLDNILDQSSKLRILRFLFLRKGDHTGRAIARGIGMSASAVSHSLRELREEGLVTLRAAGRAYLYSLVESNHLAIKLLAPLFEEEKCIIDNIISIIKNGLSEITGEIISLALFGSFAGGEETSRSDIDLLVITSTKQGKTKVHRTLEQIDPEIIKSFRTSISPYVKTREEFIRAYRERRPLIKSILLGHQLISGEPLEKIIA